MYVSEITEFIRELKDNNPAIEIDQQKGRAIWWDKEPVGLDEAERLIESGVRQAGYVYQTKL